VDVEADALLLELVDQLGSQPGQIHPQALDAVVEIGIDGLDHGGAAPIEDVDGGDSAGVDVIEEASVTHPGHGCVPGASHRGLGGIPVEAGAQQLPAQEEGHQDRKEPESEKAPALVHGILDFEKV